MNIIGQLVAFHLSPEGRKSLMGIVPIAGSFQALVIDVENLGLLIMTGGTKPRRKGSTVPVMLLRWDYIATMTFNHRMELGRAPVPLGFRPA